jgi:hypothetical protein
MTEDFAQKVAAGAGLSLNAFPELLSNARQLLEKIGCSL